MSKCKITVVRTDMFEDLIRRYCTPEETVPCKVFHVGDTFLLDREDYFTLTTPPGRFCAEAWQAISQYVFTLLQDQDISWMHNGTMLACCNDGARPVVFLLERIPD